MRDTSGTHPIYTRLRTCGTGPVCSTVSSTIRVDCKKVSLVLHAEMDRVEAYGKIVALALQPEHTAFDIGFGYRYWVGC